MSYKESFNLNYGMNAWEAGFDPIKSDTSAVTPFIDIAIGLLHLACELGKVEPSTQMKIEAETIMWRATHADVIRKRLDYWRVRLSWWGGSIPTGSTPRVLQLAHN